MKSTKREQLMMRLPKQTQPVARFASPGAISGESKVDASLFGIHIPWDKVGHVALGALKGAVGNI